MADSENGNLIDFETRKQKQDLVDENKRLLQELKESTNANLELTKTHTHTHTIDFYYLYAHTYTINQNICYYS